MRAYQIQSDAGFEEIRCIETEEPRPNAGQVKIRMRAASLNYRDLGVAMGGYLRNNRCPVIPLSDGAGEIVELGDDVENWSIGDRVSPIFVRDWIDGSPTNEKLQTCLGGGVDGVLSEYVCLPAQSVVPIPSTLSYAQAATLPCAAVTAWHALFESGDLRPGQTVLLLGTGGVSIFSLQLAKSAGARVIITSSSDAKLNKARDLNADEVINYANNPDWHKEVKRLTAGQGVDHVVEVGGPGTLERSLKSAAVGGHIHLIGVLDSPSAKISPMLTVFNLLTIRGIYVGSRVMHERTLGSITQNAIDPIIDRSFHFDEAIDAFRYFASQKHLGKVVIEW
ncbi:MAG: NAD(P)-dependent alcohol dehydrogenase [Planctomycetota bacterium]